MYTQSKNYCFTDFKNSSADLKKIYQEYKDVIRYIGWGEETCPKTGKKHLQGWIQFFNKKRLGGAQKFFNHKVHMESIKGSANDNEKYCSKEGNFYSFGKYIYRGYRTDLECVKKDILDGKKKSEIINDNFEIYCRYRNGINDFIKINEDKSRAEFRQVEVAVLSGETGTGKTRLAMKFRPDSTYKIEGDSLNWFDGYDGEECLVIDEYDNDVKITKLLNLLDGYKLRLPIKGGFTYANWKYVIITTNLTKEQFHCHAKERHRAALFRRINKWKEMN